jgi:hypothetical protein
MASAKTRLGTTQRIIGEQTGLDFLKNYGVDVEEQGRYEQLLAQLSQPTPLEYTDVKGLNSGFTFVGEQLGQTAPETGAIMGATLLGTIGGTAATGNPVAGTALGITAGALTASPTIFGGHVQRQEEEVKAGRKDKVDLTDALAATVGSATVEAIADRFLILGLIKPGQKIFSRTIGGLIEGAAVEAPTEILQQVLERAQAGLPLTDDAAMQEYITSGISGAVVGSSIRGPLAMAGIGTGDQPPPPPPPTVNPPAPAGPIAPVTQLGVTAQEPRQEDFPSTAQGIIDFNAALGQYYAGIAATTLTPEAKAAADAVAGAAPTVTTAPIETPDLGAYDLVYNVAAEQYGLDPVDIKTIYETIKAKKNTGRNAAANKIAKEIPTLGTTKNVLDLFNTIDESISKIEQEDANVVKPTVTTGSKSGTPATEPGVGDGIGLDATQGTAEPKTPAETGLGATVSDTSTDNVPEGSQSAALRAQMAEWRAAETAAKEARIAAAAAQAAAKLEEANIAETAPATAFDELEYNKKVRERSDILDRDTISENDNILYRPERAYRFIGELGYADFLESGIIRPAQNTKQAYDAAYFMKGKSSGRYGRGDSGAYIVETTPVEGAWRNDDASVYITPNSPLTKNDKIRIYKRKEDGSFEVVLDNIGDRALLPAQPAAEQTTAAAPIEEVAADLDAEVAAQAAAELKDAQLPSIDGEVPDTVKGLGDARAAADARAKGYEQNINRITAESEQARANKLAADEAQAAQIAAERTQQYGKGDLPLSRVPAEYDPMTGALGMGEEAPAARQVIPASIRVSQAPITPEKQVEPVTEKLWKEMGFSRAYGKLFFDLRGNKPVNDPEVRSRLSTYAYSSEKPNPQQNKVAEWLQKSHKVRMQGAPDVRSSAGQAMIRRSKR